jgi:hypothetical protein
MKIVIAGYIVGYPVGGMTWHHLHYLLGLRALGHDLTYLEDGAFLPPFDPTTGDCGQAEYGIDHLRRTFAAHGLAIPWHYRFGDVIAGISVDQLQEKLKKADLLICVSGVTPLDWYHRPKRTLVIDTDPVFTQLRMQGDAEFLAYYRSFTHVATFGRLIGTPLSPLPTFGIDWIGTNQPVCLDQFPVRPATTRRFTTIGKWEHTAARSVEFNGRTYASSKSVEWMKLLPLPGRIREWEFSLAMEKTPPEVRRQFEATGWHFDDAHHASRDTEAYRRYIRESAGELTVVKEIYAGLPSGWFSDRSACYLASGRPVVTQSSGFDQWLPTGEGLFSFRSIDEAAGALEAIDRDYARHSAAARRVAERHFDAPRVLTELLSHL